MQDLIRIISDLSDRVAELERRGRSRSRTGVIAQVDAVRGMARVRLSDSDPPFLTGWLPWEEVAAGANKTHNPPSVGQQVRVVSESGDLRDATVQGSIPSDSNGRPSAAGDEYVLLAVGPASIRVTGGGASIVLAVGGYSLTLSAAGAVNAGGALSHDGKDIGKTHTHGGILPGSANTDVPN